MPPRKRLKKRAQSPGGEAVTSEPDQQPAQVPGHTAAPEQLSHNGLKLHLQPITDVHQAFKDLVSRRKSEIIAIARKGGFRLRVATMCSGTEAPVFALKLIKEISQLVTNGEVFVQFEHLFSVENQPFKQAYISRNAPGSIVFRDVVDLSDPDATTAPTIFGYPCEIPTDIDLLVAGTSCVDFSSLNSRKMNNMQLMDKGAELIEEWKSFDRRPGNSNTQSHLRNGYFDEFRQWLNAISPTEIQRDWKLVGDSTTTFLCTVCYMNRHRPKMAILENVMGAPWDTMCDLFLHAAGYVATHAHLDTKDYYIPQTRQRGYAVAVDRQVFGDSAEKIVKEWKVQLRNMKRGASAPVQDWLLSPHDPLAVRARQDESEKAIANGLNPSRDSQWDRSKMRHVRVRRHFNLGNDRPLTAWGLGGLEQPYDRIDRLVIKGQNDRALDCVDIYYLRCLHAGAESGPHAARSRALVGPMQYDIRFKSQIFDLSQNIDRGQINRNFGITGCLTPRGLNLITDQGRLVSGYEALLLQGLPLRDLDLSRESQEELRDLAGNAMTTTVVGTAMFSLLISVDLHWNGIVQLPLNAITYEDKTVAPYRPLYQPLSTRHTPGETWSTALEPVRDVQQVIDISRRCRRYCYCNGGAKYSTDELVRCQVCDIVRCTSCQGNPKHRFGPPMSIENPIMNDTAPQEVMTYFPTALTNIISVTINRIPFRTGTQETALENRLLCSLRSVTFYYTQVLISENVTVCYSAKDDGFSFRLQAVISDRGVTWYLFLDPWSNDGQRLSRDLDISAAQLFRPFGRVHINPQATGFVPKRDAWEFWVFSEVSFEVNITKHHPDCIEISGLSLASLPPATHSHVQSIVGKYEHHPECDAAEDSLHVHVQHPKRYLFKDPSRIGPTQEDYYVISDECRFLEKHEFRDFYVSFLPAWDPRATEARATVLLKGYWERPIRDPTGSQFIFDGNLVSYTKHAGSSFVPVGLELQRGDDNHRLWTLASVRVESNTIAEKYLVLSKYELADPGCWAVVSRSDYSALFSLLAPVNVNLGDIGQKTPLIDTKSCSFCSPKSPGIHWIDRTPEGTRASVREPFRLSHEMRSYEERLGRCGEPFQVIVNIKDSANGRGWKEVTANYQVNIDLLMNRAANYLPSPKYDSGVAQVRTFMDITRGSLNIPNLRFESFRKSLRRLPGHNSREFIEPSRIFIDGLALTKQQEISLNWMLDREINPEPFTEREIEECRSDPLNLRMLAVAERGVARSGGILADDVGYGKTVVTLALMAAQQRFDQNESLQWRGGDKRHTLALAASLVFAPKHLVDQWRDEAAKFLGWKGIDVLVIKYTRDLQGVYNMAEPDDDDDDMPLPRGKRSKVARISTTPLDKFRAAKLIIVSTALFDRNYYTWLGKYAGSMAHPNAIPRTNNKQDTNNPNVLGAFQDWYEDATIHARKHVSGFNPTVFNQNALDTITRRLKDLKKYRKMVMADYHNTLSRLGLENLRNELTSSTTGGEKSTTSRGKLDSTASEGVLTEDYLKTDKIVYVLEAFSYARVVYDEFSYENFCVAQFVKNAKAYSKWVLSATPPTGNVRAVCDIGALLKIHVARPVKLRPGLPLITEGPMVLRQSSTDKQLSYGKLYTDKSVYERVEQAHKFLQHFASANPFDEEGLGKIKVFEKAYCSHMTRFELIKYLDVQRDFRKSDLDITSLLKRHKLDTNITTEFPSEERLHAGLALAYAASVDCTDGDYDNDEVETLLLTHRRDLEAAQENLRYVTKVAIWLVLRRFAENDQKKNDSATNMVEDLAWQFESILNGNAEAFGGADALEAITSATLDESRVEKCSRWLKSVDLCDINSAAFFEDFFTFLNEQTDTAVWATYFQLPVDRIRHLTRWEVLAFLREFSGRDHNQLNDDQAQELLEDFVTGKRPSSNSQLQQAKRRRDTRPIYPLFSARKKIRGGNYTETESELTDIMLKLTKAIEEVTARARQITTATNLTCEDAMRKCSACERSGNDLRFLPDCGHFICSGHLEAKCCGQIKSEKYPNGSGCRSLIHGRSISVEQIDRCEMGVASPSRSPKGCGKPPRVNSKSHAICSVIRHILQSSPDKVLVFFQIDKQCEELCSLLAHHQIAFDTQPRTGRSDSAAERSRGKERVRILKLGSEEAAGSNFQDANHVLFISTPVFGKQEDFEKHVKQAKGRAIRHGQVKDVSVYYFVTVNTFEVDLLQLRKKSHIRMKEKHIAYFAPMEGGVAHATDSGGDVEMMDELDMSGEEQLTSGLSDDEVWRLTDETNWLVQQNRDC